MGYGGTSISIYSLPSSSNRLTPTIMPIVRATTRSRTKIEGKWCHLTPGGLVSGDSRSNNEWQEVSRGRSSEEVPVMGMEQRTEQIYQLLKWHLVLA